MKITKDTITTIFGAIAGFAMLLGQLGVHIGHVGSVDVNTAVAATATTLLGYYANKQDAAAK